MPRVAYRLMIEGCPVEWVSDRYLESITTIETGVTPVAIVENISNLCGLAVYDDDVYFTTYKSDGTGKIYSADIDGSQKDAPVELISSLKNCRSVCVDGTYIRYNHDQGPSYGDSMWRANMDGSGATKIQEWYWGFDSYFEADATYIWFLNDYGGGSIETIPIDGGSKTYRCTAPLGAIGIAQDDTYVYYVDGSYNHFYRFEKPSGTRELIFQVDEVNPISDITVDANYIYYGRSNGDICRLSLSTLTAETICNIPGAAFRGTTNDTNYIYICDYGNNTIWRIPKGTSISSYDRERLAGLEVAGLQIREDLSLKEPISSVSPMTVTIKHERALTELIKTAQPISNLAATCMATDPETPKTISVDLGSEFTEGEIYHIGTEAFLVNSISSNDLTVTGCYWDTLKQNHYTAEDSPELNGATVIYDRPPTLEGRRAYLFRYENGEASDGQRLFDTDPGTDEYGEVYLTADELIWRGIISEPPSIAEDGLSVKIRIDPITAILNQQVGTDATGYITGIYRPYTSCVAIKVWCTDEIASHASYVPWTSVVTKHVSGYFATTEDFIAAIQSELDDLVDEQDNAIFTAIELIDEDGQYVLRLTLTTTYPLIIEDVYFEFYDNALGVVKLKWEWSDSGGPGYPTHMTEHGVAPIGDWMTDGITNTCWYQKTALGESSGLWLPKDYKVGTLYPSTNRNPQNWINTPTLTGISQYTGNYIVKDSTASATAPKNRIYANIEFVSVLNVGDVIQITNTVDEHAQEYVTITAIDTNHLYFDHEQTPERFVSNVYNSGMNSFGYRSTFMDGNTQLRIVASVSVGSIDDFISDVKSASVKANNGANPFITYADLGDTGDIADALVYDYYTNRTYRIVDKILFREFIKEELRLIGYYACLDTTGKIIFKSLTDNATPTMSITDNEIVQGNLDWQRNTQGIISTIKIEDKRLVQNEEKTSVYVIKDSNISVYKNRAKGELVIKPQSVYNNIFNPLSEDGAATLGDIGNKALSVLNHDYEVVKIPVVSSIMQTCMIGTWVAITSDHLIDTVTGTYGITARPAMVIGRTWDLDPAKGAQGTLTLLVYSQLTSTARTGWAPSAKVTGASLVSGNTWDLTCSASYFAASGFYDLSYFTASAEFEAATVKVIEFNSDDPDSQTGYITAINATYTVARVVFDAAAPWGDTFSGEWIMELYGFTEDVTVKKFIHIANTSQKVFSATEPAFKVI